MLMPSVPDPNLESPEACSAFFSAHYPSPFNWIRFAETCADRAQVHFVLEPPKEKGLPWAQVSIDCYEAMANHPRIRETRSRYRLYESAIALRASAIRALGVVEGHPVLDSRILLERFFQVVSISPIEMNEAPIFPRPSVVRDVFQLTHILEGVRQHLPELADYYEAVKVYKLKMSQFVP